MKKDSASRAIIVRRRAGIGKRLKMATANPRPAWAPCMKRAKECGRNFRSAILWYGRAAVENDPRAQYRLGVIFEKGLGVDRDYDESLKWYRAAANRQWAPAQYHLAALYESGRGLPQDEKEAIRWYERAARQGVVGAQSRLAEMYEAGRGVDRNDAEAYVWSSIAVANGDHQSARRRDRVASKHALSGSEKRPDRSPGAIPRSSSALKRAELASAQQALGKPLRQASKTAVR